MAKIERVTHPPVGNDRRQFLRRSAMAAGAAGAAAVTGTALTGVGTAGAQTPTLGYLPYAQPFRTYDSREDPEGPIQPGEIYTIYLGELPEGTQAVMTNLAVIDTEVQIGGNGFITCFPTGNDLPDVSTINYWGPGQFIANMITVATGAPNNDISIYCGGAGGTHLLVDLYGYYT